MSKKYTITYTVDHISESVDYVITIEADNEHDAIEYLLRWTVRPVTPNTISLYKLAGDAGQGHQQWPITKVQPVPVKDTYRVDKFNG